MLQTFSVTTDTIYRRMGAIRSHERDIQDVYQNRLGESHYMNQSQLNWVANVSLGIADYLLRDVYVCGKYRHIMLPMKETEGLPKQTLVDVEPR